jgi:hypothetical protein
LDLITLASNIIKAATSIDSGRKGFAIKGKAEEGRINYEIGIARAMTAFQQASEQEFAATANPRTIIVAEYTFLSQELEFCGKNDIDSLNSLTQAVQSFDDAFLALKIAEEKTFYYIVDNAIPHSSKYRVNGFPKDAFLIAIISHKTRIKNILRTPGLDPLEKALLKQRLLNLSAGQRGYNELQKKAFEKAG